MNKIFLNLSLLTFSILMPVNSWAADKAQIDPRALKEFQKKVDKLNSDYALLRKNGPESYYKSRNIRLTNAEKKQMSKDLMKILNMKMDPPYVFVRTNENKLIVKDDYGVSTFVLTDMMSGIVNDSKSNPVKITNKMEYSAIRDIFSKQK